MSSTTDYSKLKVTELREALQKRNLPTVGVKSELVARLVAADASADAPSPAANKSHLPTADDYDVDWDDNDDPAPAAAAATPNTTTTTTAATTTTTIAAPATATATAPKPEPTPAAAAPAPADPAKPKKKFASIAALFDTATPTTAAAPAKSKDATGTQNSQSPSSPSTVTDEAATSTTAAAAATTSAPKAEEPSFAAGLSASTLDVELERRKARAKRFGIDDDAAVTEATKKLEREKRFGNAGAEDAPEKKKEVVKGLDSALPDRRDRKRGAPPAQDTRGGKRTRGGNNGAGRVEQRGGQPRRAQAPAAGVQKKGGYKAILDDPAEKAKAEARARKFGVA
ncbi:uncharacterized protein H6S33_009334 [Morchella sextelata]|uniref:uncharacterized protein n=1 Tax=Morchella sextelata TaxID=1174677 RepID=UPI001D04E845|nr:uncharacterized protein H6S33_009334 [Morchella sextelata]KAH0612954.1 hypothetical protein H6S33_009334 [Morchella sextelata]